MDTYRASYHGKVIAQSGEVVLLEGNVYFPPSAVQHEYLHRTRRKSLCYWKGLASYYTVQVGGLTGRYAAWTYRHPSPSRGGSRTTSRSGAGCRSNGVNPAHDE